LDPVYPGWGFWRCGVDVDVVEDNVGGIHHVDGPKLRLDNVEVAHVDVADVPQNERHRTSWTRGTDESAFGFVSLVEIPYLPVAVDSSGGMAVDADVVSSKDEPSCVVLKGDVVGLVSPVLEVLRELWIE
jgi:hypothetical protein